MPRSSVSQQQSSEPRAPARRNRPREETRLLLLGAAARLAIRQASTDGPDGHNVLADIRITDVLAEVNRDVGEEGPRRVTTGRFYQIWPNQAVFQWELLAYLMEQIATPGADEVEKLAFDLVAAGQPPDEVFRHVSDADFRVTSRSPELFLALGLGALAPVDVVRAAQERANDRYIASIDRLLTGLLVYAGRRLAPQRTMEDLIWATEALAVGYLLRSRSHPDIPERTDGRGWTARATAYYGVLTAFTEPIPPHDANASPDA